MNVNDQQFLEKYIRHFEIYLNYDTFVVGCQKSGMLETNRDFQLLTEVMVENLNKIKNKKERNQKLWQKLMTRGPNAFKLIKDILFHTNHKVYVVLFPSEDKMHSTTSHRTRKLKVYKELVQVPKFICDALPKNLAAIGQCRGTLFFVHYFKPEEEDVAVEQKNIVLGLFQKLSFNLFYYANVSYDTISLNINETLKDLAETKCWVHVHLGTGSYKKLQFHDTKVDLMQFLRIFNNSHDVLRNIPKFFIIPVSEEEGPESKTSTDSVHFNKSDIYPTLSEMLILFLETDANQQFGTNLKLLVECMAKNCNRFVVQDILKLYHNSNQRKKAKLATNQAHVTEFGASIEFFLSDPIVTRRAD